MKLRSNERGDLNVLLIPVILVSLLFLGALFYGVWAQGKAKNYKNNVDQKVSEAVSANKKVVQAADAAAFAETAKQPLKPYTGPEAYGTLQLSYPKTWSAYIPSDGTGNTPVDAYFEPNIVTKTDDDKSTFSLRVQIITTAYADAVKGVTGQAGAAVTPYTLPKLPKIVGVRVDGAINNKKQGSMIILPLRDKTLEVWTESALYMNDFNNSILPNLTFSP
jgi:hypothetical protein